MLNGIVLHIKLVSINKADKILRFEKLHLRWKMKKSYPLHNIYNDVLVLKFHLMTTYVKQNNKRK